MCDIVNEMHAHTPSASQHISSPQSTRSDTKPEQRMAEAQAEFTAHSKMQRRQGCRSTCRRHERFLQYARDCGVRHARGVASSLPAPRWCGVRLPNDSDIHVSMNQDFIVTLF